MRQNNSIALNQVKIRLGITLILISIIVLSSNILHADGRKYVTTTKQHDSFPLYANGKVIPIIVSSNDYAGVKRVLNHLKTDIYNVTGEEPKIYFDVIPQTDNVLIVGSIEKSDLIKELIQSGKLKSEDLEGKWEKFVTQTVDNPYPYVKKALVISGSDKRGTIYGMFDLSQQIGVSPWYWWADVPIKKKEEIYIKAGSYSDGEPKVKYRGIFINDEAPALANWSIDKFGTQQFNHELYQHVFELILRLKGNFLWPAMWGRAFYDDDPKNPELAEEYGIVISTSHHEPMMRAHVEWRRYGEGPWNYEKNPDELKKFWQEGIERMGENESVVTLAMRGDGDEAMGESANIELLQNIVIDQRDIIEEVTGKDATEIPQVWALYKEVQEYYDKGMRVPDDVTLLLCDDNWGNIRKLPNLNDKSRRGGYGIYYHYDFVGGPRNYKWINTTQIERVWEQMHLAYEYNAREIWIVNVGDIKPMEFPIDFFLDYAWDPDAIKSQDLPDYYKNWSVEQFGESSADEIAYLLSMYTKYNSRRKPEMIAPGTYSINNYREAEQLVDDYNSLHQKAKSLYSSLREEYKDAFYQLVLHPIEASANLNEMYVSAAKNSLYYEQRRNITNKMADKVKDHFYKDSLITKYYNEELAEGKWNHMMDQVHIGYTNWQQPDKNIMPYLKFLDIPDEASMGVAVEGSDKYWVDGDEGSELPIFDSFNKQTYYIELFNKGKTPLNYNIEKDVSWLLLDHISGTVVYQNRIYVSVDWAIIPEGKQKGKIIVSSNNEQIEITANAIKHGNKLTNVFVESNGYISINAENYSNKIETDMLNWEVIPNLGRTGSSVTLMPVVHNSLAADSNSPRLEYDLHLFSHGELTMNVLISPILNYAYSDGIKFAVSVDNEEPVIINVNENDTPDWKYPQYWNMMVSNNVRLVKVKLNIEKPGHHKLKIWAVDPGIVYQKIIIDTGGLKPSYLGPPQSYNTDFSN